MTAARGGWWQTWWLAGAGGEVRAGAGGDCCGQGRTRGGSSDWPGARVGAIDGRKTKNIISIYGVSWKREKWWGRGLIGVYPLNGGHVGGDNDAVNVVVVSKSTEDVRQAYDFYYAIGHRNEGIFKDSLQLP